MDAAGVAELLKELPDAAPNGRLHVGGGGGGGGRGKKDQPDKKVEPVKVQTIDKEKIEKVAADLHKGGKSAILVLIDMLVEPGQGDDMKARYALHCVALHVCKPEIKSTARKEFGEILASKLGGDKKNVHAFLCQELQWAGGREAAAALGKLLTDEVLCEPAAMALVAIKDGAIEQFRAALPKAQGKCRLTVIQDLGWLKDEASAPALKAALADQDREIRLAAGWGLANMGDATAVDALLKASDKEKEGWERIQTMKHCFVLAEKLAESGKKAESAKIYKHLSSTRTDASEKYVKESAERALAALK